MPGKRLWLLAFLRPTYPFITGKRRNIVPYGQGFWIGKNSNAKIFRYLVMDGSGRQLSVVHTIQSIAIILQLDHMLKDEAHGTSSGTIDQ